MTESVYNLVRKEVPAPPKPPLYRSIHRSTVDTHRKSHATFGVAKTERPAPSRFLRKHAKEVVLPDRTLAEARPARPHSLPRPQSRAHGIPISMPETEGESTFSRRTQDQKPPVPSHQVSRRKTSDTATNYITLNAVDAVLAIPKQPKQDPPRYVKKPDFGKVPEYLETVKQQVHEEYTMIAEASRREELAEESASSSSGRLLSHEEKERLLDGLKKNWEVVNRAYQTLSFSLDTPAKKQRKEEYEAQLEQIEQDIEKLNREYIFVQDA